VRFRKCENWGWFKGLIILSEQPIMIQQIAVCQKFYLKPKINKNHQLTLYHYWIVKKCQNWKILKTTFFDTRNYKDLIKSSFSKSRIIEKTFFLVPFFLRYFFTKILFELTFLPENVTFYGQNGWWKKRFTWYKMVSYLNTFWNLSACPKSFSITWCFAGSF